MEAADLDIWALKLSRLSATTKDPGRLFHSLMACGKYEFRYTDVLVCGTRNLMEWPRVLYSDVCCRYGAGGMSTRSYTIRNIMTTLALLRLTSSGVQFRCCIMAVTLLVRRKSPVAKRAALRWTASIWVMLPFLAGLHTVDAFSKDGLTSVE